MTEIFTRTPFSRQAKTGAPRWQSDRKACGTARTRGLGASGDTWAATLRALSSLCQHDTAGVTAGDRNPGEVVSPQPSRFSDEPTRRLEEHRMTWLAVGGLAWGALALGLGLIVGRGIRHADRRDHLTAWASRVDQYTRGAVERPLAMTTPAPRGPRN